MRADVRKRLNKLGARLRPTQLGGWLAAINVAIVLAAVGGLSLSAIDLLRDAADEEGRARVQLAGATAREDLRRMVEDTLTAARVLSDRPTLHRLLAERDIDSIEPFLRRYCERVGLDACAVFESGKLVAQVGPALPWPEIAAAQAEQGDGFLAAPRSARVSVMGGTARLTGRPEARVIVLRLLDEQIAQTLAQHLGIGVRLIGYRSFLGTPTDDLTLLHSASLADGRSSVQRLDERGLYVSSIPVFAATGEVIALIETRLPITEVERSLDDLIQRLLMMALVVAALTTIAGTLLGRRLADPLRALADAANRVGQGDFSASIPRSGAGEVGLLARTMEDMRRNLVDLTSTLRRREAEAHAVLGGIVEGVYAVDRDRRIRYLNPQAAKLLGVEAGEVVGRFCGDVLRPRETNGRRPCESDCPILRARAEGGTQVVEWLQTDRGTRTMVITSSESIEGLQVQVMRDETELEAVRRARDSVLANISHEFRTPLAAQLASIELLRENLDTLPPERQRELVLSLERGTSRLTRLIDNLLESVRIEAGQLGIRRQSVDVAAVLEDAQGLIASLLAARRQALEIALPEDLPLVVGDEPRLTQVFVNLLANASKFAPEGSTVRIGAAAGDDRLTIRVEDEGPGIPNEEGESIFERFRRGRDEEPAPGGLGLGLWIVKSIVDRHGGTVSVERTGEGRTRFNVVLPVEETE